MARNTTRRGIRKILKFHPQPSLDDRQLEKPNPLNVRIVKGPEPTTSEPERPKAAPARPKSRPMPAMRAARMKATEDAYVSPQDGTPACADTCRAVLTDDHGNTVRMADMAASRPWQRIRRWFVDNFGA